MGKEHLNIYFHADLQQTTMKDFPQSWHFAPKFCVQVKVIADADNVTGAAGNLLMQLQHLLENEKIIAAKATIHRAALARLQPAAQGE